MVKNILLIILLIVSSVSLFLNTKFYKTLQLENKVVEVVDGDTFLVVKNLALGLIFYWLAVKLE